MFSLRDNLKEKRKQTNNKNSKHELETQNCSCCLVLKESLNLGCQSNLFSGEDLGQRQTCYSRPYPPHWVWMKSSSSDFILASQSFKRYTDFPWVSLEIKNIALEKKQGLSYFLNGIFSCSKFNKLIFQFNTKVL